MTLWGLVHAGTAVGIATAFGAPIGGLLFAFEELANSFSQALGWQIFFACMLAVLTLDTFKSAQHAARQGHFGLFDGDASTVFFEVSIGLQGKQWIQLSSGLLVQCHQLMSVHVFQLH